MTLGFLSRLALWGFGISLLQGWIALGSLWVWDWIASVGAEARYRLACAHFAALVAGPALTIFVVGIALRQTAGTAPAMGDDQLAPPGLVGDPLFWVGLALSLIWIVGALAMAGRIISGLSQLNRLPTRSAPPKLVERVRQLSGNVRGAYSLRIFTGNVATPQIVGLWRPSLIAPRDLGRWLDAAEQDAVLLHELAHLHRGDFGWNLLQRALLSLLWLQPAAWLLYRRLYLEREASCDHFAVQAGASPKALAHALLRLAGGPAGQGMAMSSAGPGDLTARIHLLVVHPQRLTPTRSCWGPSLVSALSLTAIAMGRLASSDVSLTRLYLAGAFGPTISVEAHDAVGSFMLRIKQGRVLGAVLGRTRLSQDQIIQRGDHVALLPTPLSPGVALTVSPLDRVHWTSRKVSPAGGDRERPNEEAVANLLEQ